MKIRAALIHETPAALGIAQPDTTQPLYWLPRSEIAISERHERVTQTLLDLQVPDWLAKEKHCTHLAYDPATETGTLDLDL